MDDYWDSQGIFELQHAAYLLSGSYPPNTYEPRLPPKVKAALDLLEFEIKAGRLEVLHWEYPGTRHVRRKDLQRLAEQQDYRPATLFPDQPPAPATVGPDDKSLSAIERANLQKQIAVLAMLLSEKTPKFKLGDKPNYKQLAQAVQGLLDEIAKVLAAIDQHELNRYGVSATELRENMSVGVKLLFGKKD